jgi:hypothetical protein
MYIGDDNGPSGDFYSNSKLINTSSGAYLTTGGTWTDNSSRTVKENIDPVDGPAVLERVESLPVSEWGYEDEPDDIRHVGPMAEDFHEMFGLGADDEHIASLDTAGIALAAIKGLSKQLDERDERINDLETELDAKDARIDDQTDRIEHLEAENDQLRDRLAAIESQLGMDGSSEEESR